MSRVVDLYNILIIAVIAVMEALGGVTLFCGLFGVDLAEIGACATIGIVFGFAGILFAILLLFYYNKEQ